MTAARILGRKKTGAVTIQSDATVAQAVEILAEKNIGALVVSDDGVTVAGILSERDIIRGLGEAGPALLERRIASIMVRKVQTVAPSESADRMLGRMTEGRFRHLPVMENGRLTGVVSIGDVVKLRLDDLIGEAEAMRDYIAG
jgi:CBS domain-containing protein